MNLRPFLSIVLCTYSRTEEVFSFLRSIRTLPSQDYELVVIDQNPDSRVEEIPAASGILPAQYVKLPYPNLSHARNVGAGLTKGEYVLFADDDSQLHGGFINDLRRVLHKYPDSDAIAAVLYGLNSDKPINKFSTSYPFQVDFRNVWYSFWAAGVVFKSAVVSDYLFDEQFGFNAKYKAAEDLDIALRLLNGGKKIYYVPELYLYHPHTVTKWTPLEITKMKFHTYGFGAAIRKNLTRANAPPVLLFFLSRLIRPLVAGIAYALVNPVISGAYFNAFIERLCGFLQYDPGGVD